MPTILARVVRRHVLGEIESALACPASLTNLVDFPGAEAMVALFWVHIRAPASCLTPRAGIPAQRGTSRTSSATLRLLLEG